MMRHAVPSDFQFIHNLILDGARAGHFERQLLTPAATRGLEVELMSVLTSRVRVSGIKAYALIWESNKNPIGFVIISAGPENEGNELWLAAISPEYRDRGEGKKMILETLRHFKGKHLMLMARCAPESKAMFHILTSNGFSHVDTGKEGSRGLLYTL
jgi:ribosomal protein S18 acetylase RimI-like enzyme